MFSNSATQNNSDAIAATHIKWKIKITQLELFLTHSLHKTPLLKLFSIFFFKRASVWVWQKFYGKCGSRTNP